MNIKLNDFHVMIVEVTTIAIFTISIFWYNNLPQSCRYILNILEVIFALLYVLIWIKEIKRSKSMKQDSIVNISTFIDRFAYNIYNIIDVIFGVSFLATIIIVKFLKIDLNFISYWYWFVLGMYISSQLIYFAYGHLRKHSK